MAAGGPLESGSPAGFGPASRRCAREEDHRDDRAPCLVAHGIGPANGRQRGSAVVWCSPVDQIQVVGQDATAVDCTDLWVEVDADHSTLPAHLEGEDLARHVSGAGSVFEPAPPVSLGDHLDGALVEVARLLDELCSELVIIPRERDRSVD